MTPQELIKNCQKQIDICGDDADTAIIMRGRWGKKDYKTLLGVKGEIVFEGLFTITVMFPAKKLMQATQKSLACYEIKEVQP